MDYLSQLETTWTCQVCTFKNQKIVDQCQMCDSKKKSPIKLFQAQQIQAPPKKKNPSFTCSECLNQIQIHQTCSCRFKNLSSNQDLFNQIVKGKKLTMSTDLKNKINCFKPKEKKKAYISFKAKNNSQMMNEYNQKNEVSKNLFYKDNLQQKQANKQFLKHQQSEQILDQKEKNLLSDFQQIKDQKLENQQKNGYQSFQQNNEQWKMNKQLIDKLQEQDKIIKNQKMNLEQNFREDSYNFCSMCDNLIDMKDIALLECGHLYHKSCLNSFVSSIIEFDQTNLQCPYPSCSRLLSHADIKDYCDQKISSKFKELIQKAPLINDIEGATSCPNKLCSAVFFVEGQVQFYDCYACKKSFCLKCKEAKHTGMNCAEFHIKNNFYQIVEKQEKVDQKKEIGPRLGLSEYIKPGVSYPKFWNKYQQHKLELFKIDKKSDEYKFVSNMFTLSKNFEVSRIQNVNLYERYYYQKQTLENEYKQSLKQQFLFHGTRATDPQQIYGDKYTSFNINYAADGARGKGIYFAKQSQYSSSYVYMKGSSKQMFLSIVLVGHSQNVNNSGPNGSIRKITSFRDQKNNFRYDSVYSRYDNSDIYVVFHNNRAYPLYLISY